MTTTMTTTPTPLRRLTGTFDARARHARQSSGFNSFAQLEVTLGPASEPGVVDIVTAGMVLRGALDLKEAELVEFVDAFSIGVADACRGARVDGVTVQVREVSVHSVDSRVSAFRAAGLSLVTQLVHAAEDVSVGAGARSEDNDVDSEDNDVDSGGDVDEQGDQRRLDLSGVAPALAVR